MGIQGLNKWLEKNINKIKDVKGLQIDTLFIDGQQIYYPILFDDKKNSNIDDMTIFTQQCDEILNEIQPKNFLFFAMDGPNPAAKFQKQRMQRYKEQILNIQKSNTKFIYPDENSVQNEFFEKENSIDDVLKKYLSEKVNDKDSNTPKYLYSSRHAAGEAEHKYFDYFRKQKRSDEWKPNQNHFIFSNDNDLIFLALQFVDENFYIIKFNFNDGHLHYHIIDISLVRECLLNKIHNRLIERTPQFIKRVIDDIIGLSFILGNDFIPQFPDMFSNSQKLDQIITSYSILNKNRKSDYQFLIENNSFKVSTLREILKIYYSYQAKIRYYNKYQHSQSNRIEFSTQMTNLEKKEMAQSLLRIFNFTWLYYSEGVPSWTYYYPYKTTLKLQEAVSLMTQEGKEFFENLEDKEMTTPFLKTLVTHSQYQPSGLPWNIYKIKVPSSSSIAEKYWPLIDDYNNVPMFNLTEIKEQYKNELKNLSDEELEKNKIDPPYFEYSKDI